MNTNQTILHRRINITLPKETVGLLDRVAQKGDRSRLINEAVRRYLENAHRASLRKRLKEGAIKRSERDRILAKEWFFLEELEEETWRASKK